MIIMIYSQKGPRHMKEQQEKKILTQWENMEKELQEELTKYSPLQLKEMAEHWKGSLKEDEIEPDSPEK